MCDKSMDRQSELDRYELRMSGTAIERLYNVEIGDHVTGAMAISERTLFDQIEAVCTNENTLDSISSAMGDYANTHMRHGFVVGFRCAMRLMFEAGGPKDE